MATNTRKRPAKPAVKLPPVVVPESLRCQVPGCERPKAAGDELCRAHMREHGSLAAVKENEVVGGAAVGEVMREELGELARLRAELLALKAANAATEPERTVEPAANPDPEIEGDRLAAEMSGTARRPATGKPPKPAAPKGLPVEAEGTSLALALLRQAKAETKARAQERGRDRKRRGLSADEGRVPIEMRLEMPAQLDPAAIVDEFGNNLVPPGYVGRWVTDYKLDPNGGRHPSNYKEQVLRQMWHARPVMEPVYDADGKKTSETRVKTGLLGKAMMYPVQDYARRVIYHSPAGAFDQDLDDQVGALDNLAEETNSAYGKKGGVIHPYVPEEHGDRSPGF